MSFFSICWVGIERWSPPLVLWLCIKGGGQGICLQFQADSKPYQSQVLLVIMCSCNSSNSAPCSCSWFAKVNGKSPAFSQCCCIKQWEATGHERPELVSVVEGVLTTMREKFPMDLDVLKLETDSMKHPRGDLQRNGSPKRNQTWRIPKKSTEFTEGDKETLNHKETTFQLKTHGEACYMHNTRQNWGSGGKNRCGKARWILWGSWTIPVCNHVKRHHRFKAWQSTNEREEMFCSFLKTEL